MEVDDEALAVGDVLLFSQSSVEVDNMPRCWVVLGANNDDCCGIVISPPNSSCDGSVDMPPVNGIDLPFGVPGMLAASDGAKEEVALTARGGRMDADGALT